MSPDPHSLTLPDVGGPMMILERALWLVPLLVGSAFFAGTETALLSLTGTQRDTLSAEAGGGDTGAGRILWLLSNPRRLITTLILGNELINISISTLMTGVVSRLFALLPASFQAHHPLSDEALVATVATVATVPLLILFGELVPKTIGIKIAPRWARATAALTLVLTYALWIPRVVISALAGAVTFPFLGRAQRSAETTVLREREFRTLVDMGSAEGEIAGTERRMIHNVFEFGDLTVGKIMTPAAKVFALPVETPLSRAVEAVSRQRRSRVPVYRGRRDNVVGILFAKDLVGSSRGELRGRPLQDLLHPPLFVPRRAKCDRLFREFQRRKTHMALVVDEYGKLAGLITMEDLLHSLFGDLAESEEARLRDERIARASVAPGSEGVGLREVTGEVARSGEMGLDEVPGGELALAAALRSGELTLAELDVAEREGAVLAGEGEPAPAHGPAQDEARGEAPPEEDRGGEGEGEGPLPDDQRSKR